MRVLHTLQSISAGARPLNIQPASSQAPNGVQVGRQSGAFRTLLTHFSQRYPKIPIMDPSFAASTCIASDLMRINLAGAPA